MKKDKKKLTKNNKFLIKKNSLNKLTKNQKKRQKK